MVVVISPAHGPQPLENAANRTFASAPRPSTRRARSLSPRPRLHAAARPTVYSSRQQARLSRPPLAVRRSRPSSGPVPSFRTSSRAPKPPLHIRPDPLMSRRRVDRPLHELPPGRSRRSPAHPPSSPRQTHRHHPLPPPPSSLHPGVSILKPKCKMAGHSRAGPRYSWAAGTGTTLDIRQPNLPRRRLPVEVLQEIVATEHAEARVGSASGREPVPPARRLKAVEPPEQSADSAAAASARLLGPAYERAGLSGLRRTSSALYREVAVRSPPA